MKPVVTIIVPVYNAQKTVRRCLESILAQDFKQFELLVIDDGSWDDSPAICDEFAEKDSRVHVIHKENSGVSQTRNIGLSMARGQYIQFLDSDDWITPEATRTLLSAAQQTSADLVVADFYRVVGERVSTKGSITKEKLMFRDEFAGEMLRSPADFYYGVIWNKLYRRKIIEKYQIRMDPNLNWCEDFIFNLEYLLHMQTVYCVQTPIYYYVKTEGSLVDETMKSGGVMRQKLKVLEYYNRFYKNIYSGTSYALRAPVIYSFLLNFAHDDTVRRIMPGTKKLGSERTVLMHDADVDAWTVNYYERVLIRREGESIRLQYHLTHRAMLVIAYLYAFGPSCVTEEFAWYVGVSQRALSQTLRMMSGKKLVIQMREPEEKELEEGEEWTVENAAETKAEDTWMPGEAAEPILQDWNRMLTDLDAMMTEGFTESEKTEYLALRKKSFEGIKKRLSL